MICKRSEPHLKVYTPLSTGTNKNNKISRSWFIHIHGFVLYCSSMLQGLYIPGHWQISSGFFWQNDTQNVSVMWLWIISQLFFFFLTCFYWDQTVQITSYKCGTMDSTTYMDTAICLALLKSLCFVHRVKRGDKYSQYNHHNTDKTYVYLT